MIGDLFNNNKRRDVCTREGQRFYRGIKYSVERGTGYLVATTGKRRRLHVVMWETEMNNGEPVPPGHIVHHIDWDKTHNVIENLALVTVQEHNLIHNPPAKGTESERELEILNDLRKRGLILDKHAGI